MTDNILNDRVGKVANVNPKEAASVIENANLYELAPDGFADLKYKINRTVESEAKLPPDISPVTEEIATQDDTHLALFQNDLHKMNAVEKRYEYLKRKVVDDQIKMSEMSPYYSKRLWGGTLTEEEEADLKLKNEELAISQEETENVVSGVEEFGTEVVVGGTDMFKGYYENKELIAGFAAGGATIGGTLGFILPMAGTTALGAWTGAKMGAHAGFVLAGAKHGFEMMSEGTIRELDNARDNDGNPLDIDENTKRVAAFGVGVLGAALEGTSSFFLGVANPWLKNVMNPKSAAKYLLKSPSVLAAFTALGNIGKGFLVEGTTEGAQELVQSVAVNLAKMDESEASFINALTSTVDTLTSSETWKRAGKATAVGGFVGAGFSGVTNITGYGVLKEQHLQKKAKILARQNRLLETVSLLESTEVQSVAPKELRKFEKKIASYIYDDDAYLTVSDYQSIANTPEKMAAVAKIIDPDGKLAEMAEELNVAFPLTPLQQLDLVKEDKSYSDYLRTEPEGSTPKEVRTEAQEQVKRLEEAETKRQEILKNLPEGEQLTEEQQNEINDILNFEPEDKAYSNKLDYYDDAVFEPIEGIVSEEEVRELNQKDLEARRNVAETLAAETDKAYRIKQDKEATELFKQDEKELLDRHFEQQKTIKQFKNVDIDPDMQVQIIGKHAKKGYSIFAIDPDSLTPLQKEKYLNNPMLKRRKVFVKGGINIEESAALVQVPEGGDKLLDILANTPTKKDLNIKRNELKASRKKQIQEESLQPERIKEQQEARDKAFSKVTTLELRRMKHLQSKELSTINRGVIKIAGKTPTSAELNVQAKSVVNDIKVGALNPRVFINGYKKSKRKALQSWVKTEFENTYKNLKAAALNNEITKESMNAQVLVHKYEKMWIDIKSKKNQKMLKNTGNLEAMNELTELFNFSTKSRGLRELKSFNNWMKKQVSEGKLVPFIPKRLDDVRQTSRDLTVGQYVALSKVAAQILETSKSKNELIQLQKARKDLVTLETVRAEIQKEARKHVQYDPNRVKQEESDPDYKEGFFEKLKDPAGVFTAAFTNMKNVTFKLDRRMFDGFFHDTISKPIKEQYNSKRAELRIIHDRDKKIVTQYGMKKFRRMYIQGVTVPEFNGFSRIGNGKGTIKKINMLTLVAYMGDPDGRTQIENFVDDKGNHLTTDIVQNVIDRELSFEDVALVQSLMSDKFKRFTKRSEELAMRTTGDAPSMVQGVPIRWRDKELPGGFYPIVHLPVLDSEGKVIVEDVTSDPEAKKGEYFAKYRSAEMTNQDRMKIRTGSKKQLDLRFDNMFRLTEQVVHDLHFREVGADVMKVLNDRDSRIEMKAVVGTRDFNAMVDGVKSVISNQGVTFDNPLFKETNSKFMKLLDTAHSLHAIKAIAYSHKSIMMQAVSFKNVALRFGPGIAIPLIRRAKEMASNPLIYHQYMEFAGMLNPDIILEKDGITTKVIKHDYSWVPADQKYRKNYTKGKIIQDAVQLRDKINDVGFSGVREADKFSKVLTTMAIADHFINGKIKGYSAEKIATMSNTEKAAKLRSIVQQGVDLTLTASSEADKSGAEKSAQFSLVTKYFTDRRATLNAEIGQMGKVLDLVKEGNYAEAAIDMATLAFVAGLSQAYVAAIGMGAKKVYDKLTIKDEDDALDLIKETAMSFATAPVWELAENTPILDMGAYALRFNSRSEYRTVGMPAGAVLADIVMGAAAVTKILSGRTPGKVGRKALLDTIGYVGVKGLPTNSINRYSKAITGKDLYKNVSTILGDAYQAIEKYIEDVQGEEGSEQLIKDLRSFQKQIPQKQMNPADTIPIDAKDIMYEASSKGEWDAYNPDTTEAGIYQFSEDRWKEIQSEAPYLGLTDNGRVSKDPTEQEKAMDWSMENNAKILIDSDVPVDNKTLYGAHKFGVENYIAIHDAKPEEKLVDVLGKEEANSPLFKDFKNVKSITNFINKKLSESVKEFDNN